MGCSGDYRGERSALQHQTTHGLFSAPCAPKKKTEGRENTCAIGENYLFVPELGADATGTAANFQGRIILAGQTCKQVRDICQVPRIYSADPRSNNSSTPLADICNMPLLSRSCRVRDTTLPSHPCAQLFMGEGSAAQSRNMSETLTRPVESSVTPCYDAGNASFVTTSVICLCLDKQFRVLYSDQG